MARNVALDIDRYRKAGDMAGHHLHMHGKRGGLAAVSLGTDAEGIYLRERFPFKFRQPTVRPVRLAHAARESPLREQRRFFDRAPDTHTDNGWRAGIRPGFFPPYPLYVFFMPSIPDDGRNITELLIFSLPPPSAWR